jgi:LmbE family N-acetylglucosaminyl deacetylase
MAKETVLVICAHNDDQIVGAGGTMVKYKKEGKKVKTIVFSYGEKSHPHLKRHVVRKERKKEGLKSDKVLGCDGIEFLDVPEGKFLKLKEQMEAREKLKAIIKKEKPSKIFTHNLDDPHPDHRAVLDTVMEVVKFLKYKGDLYSFNVWNPLNIRRRDSPKLVVDVSDTFRTKIKAFFVHQSQKGAIISLLWNVYFQAILNGMKNNVKYAEVFYKIK